MLVVASLGNSEKYIIYNRNNDIQRECLTCGFFLIFFHAYTGLMYVSFISRIILHTVLSSTFLINIIFLSIVKFSSKR